MMGHTNKPQYTEQCSVNKSFKLFPSDIINIIISFVPHWIMNSIDNPISIWKYISSNPNAAHLLEDNLDKICWDRLSINPKAIHMIKKYPNKINWKLVSWNTNPDILHLLYSNRRYYSINWEDDKWDSLDILLKRDTISSNPNAIDMSNNENLMNMYGIEETNKGFLVPYGFSRERNHLNYLKDNPHMIDWQSLSGNAEAYDLISTNLDKINWSFLSRNTNPNVINILNKNINKIDWKSFSRNKNALYILKQHKNKIDWSSLAENSNPKAIDLFYDNVLNIYTIDSIKGILKNIIIY